MQYSGIIIRKRKEEKKERKKEQKRSEIINSKLFLGILLILGFMFAGTFPQQISGTDLALTESEGDTTSGAAYYESADQSANVMVSIIPMSSSEWQDVIYSIDESEINIKTENGIDYYYDCETGQYYSTGGEGSVCGIVFYYNGAAYTLSIFKEGASHQDTVSLGINVGNQVAGIQANGGYGNGANDGVSVDQFCPCSLGLVLIGLTLLIATRFN